MRDLQIFSLSCFQAINYVDIQPHWLLARASGGSNLEEQSYLI